MLVSQEELRFDFKGAQFDLKSDKERKLLAWIFDQFLYGEASGIQCGYWLYRAPNFNAAVFLAKQAGEELSHFRRIIRIFSILGEKPKKAHWAIRFLSSGMMGNSWGEHVAIEMALGEGLVLGVFYAMVEVIGDREIQRIIASAIPEEEKHVEFGERETAIWLRAHPNSKELLMGLALIQVWVLHGLKKYVVKKLSKELGPAHPVGTRFAAFYEHLVGCFELRIERLGLFPTSFVKMTFFQKLKLLGLLPFRLLKEKFKFRKPVLTDAYLSDPILTAELQKFPLSSTVHE